MRNAKQWGIAALAAIAGFALVNFGNIASSIVVLVLVLAFVIGLTTPILFPRSLSDELSRVRAAESGVPLIYWRPGCIFCFRLRLAMMFSRKRAVWTNIHSDDAASARVRSVNEGNETVPTVFVGSESHTNPSPSWVLAQFV